MPKIQWERLPREKWAHLRDRAKEREISEEDLFERRRGRPKIPTCPTATGTRISERSNCVVPGGIRARFLRPVRPHGASACEDSSIVSGPGAQWFLPRLAGYDAA